MPLHQFRTKYERESKLQKIFTKFDIQGNNDTDNFRKLIDLVHEKLVVDAPPTSVKGSITTSKIIDLAQCYYRSEDLENPRYVFCDGKRIQVTVCKNKQDRYLSKDNMCIPEGIRKERIKYLEQQRKKYNIPRPKGKSRLGNILTPADTLRMDREAKERRIQELFERNRSKDSSLKWEDPEDDMSGWNKLRGLPPMNLKPVGLNIFPEKKKKNSDKNRS